MYLHVQGAERFKPIQAGLNYLLELQALVVTYFHLLGPNEIFLHNM